ncbi:MAG TPA: hypothetical protein VFA26_06450, partial [Gemmataceae bacterium]|nr:hypothetical protein [Gemmataceae bacterium]
MWDYLILFLVFALFAGLTYGGYLLLSRPRQRVEQRLQTATASDPSLGSTPELLLGDLTPALAGAVPMAQGDRTELQRELRTAGYYRPTAVTEYAALRAVLIIVPLIAAGILALFTETTKEAAWIWGGGILLAILGFSVPRVFVYYRGKARMHAIERGLPTAIDMLTLCLGAGLNVLNSLERVTQELHLAFPVLAEEMEIVRRQAELRTLEF